MSMITVKSSVRSLKELDKKKCCLLVYRVVDKAVRQRERVCSPIPLTSAVIRDVVGLVYRNPKKGLIVLKTDPKPYLTYKSALITDIVVIAPSSQRSEALDIFDKAKRQSNSFRRERLGYVEKQVMPLIRDLFERQLILGAALRGNSFEKRRFATPFDDIDILLFLQWKNSMREIERTIRATPEARSIRILYPKTEFRDDTLSRFTCRCFTLEENLTGNFDVEFDLVYLEECFNLLYKKADLPPIHDFVEFGRYALASSYPVIGGDYIALKENELRKLVKEMSSGKT